MHSLLQFISPRYLTNVNCFLRFLGVQKNQVMNFLVRIALLTADAKEEHNVILGKRSFVLFEKGVNLWNKEIVFEASPFEQLFSSCAEDALSAVPGGEDKQTYEKQSKAKSGGKAGKGGIGNEKLCSEGEKSKDSQKGGQSKVGDKLLYTFLDICTTMIEKAPRNHFLPENATKLKVVLLPCFTRALQDDGEPMRAHLQAFLVALLSFEDFFPVHFISHVKVLMEGALLSCAQRTLETRISDKKPNSLHLSPGRMSGRTKTDNNIYRTDQQQWSLGMSDDNGDFPALFMLRVVDSIYERGKKSVVEFFAGTLLKVADALSQSEIVKFDAQDVSKKIFATPIIGIMETVCGHRETQFLDQRKKDPALTLGESHLGASISALILCMRLLANSSIPFTFSQKRKDFFSMLSSIMDTSGNILLLMTCVAFISKWLVEKVGCPITPKERNSFIWKMTLLDARGLPDVSAQPLHEMVATTILSLHDIHVSKATSAKADGTSLGKRSVVPADNGFDRRSRGRNYQDRSKHIKRNSDNMCSQDLNEDFLLARSLTAGLMCANPWIRSATMSIFGTQSKTSVEETRYEQLRYASKIGCRDDDTTDVAGIPGRSPIDVLWQLLYTDWEGLGSRYWVTAFVDLMVASSDHSGGMRLVRSGDTETVYRSTSYDGPMQVMKKEEVCFWIKSPKVAQDEKDKTVIVIDVAAIDSGYKTFQQRIASEQYDGGAGRGRCLSALRNLAHCDVELCHNLFQSLLCSAWLRCPSNCARFSLVPALESLLARPYHSQFLPVGKFFAKGDIRSSSIPPLCTNSIKSFLVVLTRVRPIPLLDIDLLLSLAKYFNAWHEVILMIEHYLSALSSEGGVSKTRNILLSSLRYCYDQLGESELSLSVALYASECPSTRRALTLEFYGRVDTALALYDSLIEQGEGQSRMLNISASREISLWEERWVELNKELCQWGVLTDYANATKSTALSIESAWKSRDWKVVRNACASPSNVACLEGGDPVQKIYEIYLSIANGKLDSVENLHAQTGQLCLYRWQLLPEFPASCGAKTFLLQCFHRLVELRESGQLLVEAVAHSNNRTMPDLKNLLTAWRERIPNEYDSITAWEDLFTWRSHVFGAIASKFQWSDPGSLATLHDRPWTAIQVARIARKQGRKDVALLSLSKLTDCAMDVSDAFSKLREQIVIYRDSKSHDELRGGLNLVNTTNLSYFDQAQKSELFRLKAAFLNSLGGRAKSNQAYCQSLQICPSYAKSWLSWGQLCSSLAELTERQEACASTSGSETTKASSMDKKAVQYLAQAMGCYLEAIQCGAHEWSRINIPRCLWMLRKDFMSPGLLCQTFEARSKLLPEWVWLPWIPQLLTSLGRNEAVAVKNILKRVLARYPQALYFGLRAYYLERRDVERAHRSTGSCSQQQFPTVAHAEDLMSSLRRAQPQLWSSLEAVLEELIVRFRPSLEEELLNTIKALLQRGTHQLENLGRHGSTQRNDSDDGTGDLFANFSKTLARIATKFFRTSASIGGDGSGLHDGRAKRAVEFAARYKTAFERDFLPKEAEPESSVNVSPIAGQSAEYAQMMKTVEPLSLNLIVERLGKWQRILERSIADSPPLIPLQQVSSVLTAISSEAPDLWEGACDPRGSHEDGTQNDSVAPNSPSTSAVAASAAASAAACSVAAQAAAEGVGGFFGGGAAAVEIPGQYAPYSTNAFDSKPRPELNAKLIRFEPIVEVLRDSDGQQLMRRISMIGSDGKTHRFLLQFNGSYFTRIDEHSAQLHYLMDKAVRKGLLSSRKNLGIKANIVVPIAQRLRLTADDPSHSSLGDIFVMERSVRGLQVDAPQIFFKEETAKRLEEKMRTKVEESTESSVTADNEKNATIDDVEISLEVYNKICNDMVEPNILSRHINAALERPEFVFAFRKRLALELALESLLQYAFNVVDRTPSRLVMNTKNGQVIPTEFRIAYSNQGLLEGNKIPFRMTRNLETLFGPFVIDGLFVPAMASAAEAFASAEESLNPALCLILRDDIVSWYCSKSPPRSDTKNQELERQLGERIIKNSSLVLKRVTECAPDKEADTSKQDVADSRVKKLLDIATAPENLCLAPLSFQAWL